jgi:large subunit ribosomal protein L30
MAPETQERALRITWVKSGIGYSATQKRTLKALGLRRLGDVVVQKDNAAVRGMVLAVNHLLEVEEVSK